MLFSERKYTLRLYIQIDNIYDILVYICTYIKDNLSTHTLTHIHIYIYTHTHTYIYIYIHVWIQIVHYLYRLPGRGEKHAQKSHFHEMFVCDTPIRFTVHFHVKPVIPHRSASNLGYYLKPRLLNQSWSAGYSILRWPLTLNGVAYRNQPGFRSWEDRFCSYVRMI